MLTAEHANDATIKVIVGLTNALEGFMLAKQYAEEQGRVTEENKMQFVDFETKLRELKTLIWSLPLA